MKASHPSSTAGTFKTLVSHLMVQRVIRMNRRTGYCRYQGVKREVKKGKREKAELGIVSDN